MTTAELHKYLDDDKCVLTIKQVTDIINEMFEDVFHEQYKNYSKDNLDKYHYYAGEQNAFRIVLRLLDKVKEN